jgi:chromosome segregation ATPase
MIDDSGLFHGVYDPIKAREYYLRTRTLKGRKSSKTTSSDLDSSGSRSSNTSAVRSGGKPNRVKTQRRQGELRAQRERLEARLDRLREVLSELVEAAKKRSGGDPNKKDEKDKAPETQTDKADRNKDEKDRKPLTAKQKADKARKAKEAYEKENSTTLSQDVDILQGQIQDIQTKIRDALTAARERRNKAGAQDSKSGSKNNSGPRGR